MHCSKASSDRSSSKINQFEIPKQNSRRSGFTHARSKRVLPNVIIREGLFRQSSPCLVGDNHILYKSGPTHIGVSKRFRHKPLVWFYGFITMTHVPACPDYQLCKVTTMGHHKNIRLQADQEVKGCQTCYMLSETS